MNKIPAALAFLLCWPLAAHADSDGYFCIGRGYLAYETRFSAARPEHQLHVVRFDAANGLLASPPVPLDDFQVHGMNCGSDVVELFGWETVYSVDISNPQVAKITARSATLDPAQAKLARNLGHSAQEQVIDLPTDDGPSGVFQLVIARVSRRVRGGMEHYTFSQIIRRAPADAPMGHFGASHKLFEGMFRETAN